MQLAGRDREGSPLSASYRGPLIASSPGTAPLLPATGDISFPAAFQLGRLLGAADGRFTREMVGWHRSVDAAARNAASVETIEEALRSSIPEVAAQRRRETPRGIQVALGARLLEMVLDRNHRAADPWRVHPAARELMGRPRRAPVPARESKSPLAELAQVRTAHAPEVEVRG